MDFSNPGQYSYDGEIWVDGKPIDLTFVCDKPDAQSDAVHSPTHYTSGGIECWDAMQAAYGVDALKDFCLLNAFKYLWRIRQKNGLEDIDKAIAYLEKYREFAERTDNESTENGTT